MTEPWQAAAQWLNRVGVLSSDNPALSPQGRVYDLALALQDGTALCAVLNRLQPGSINVAHPRPVKQFQKISNINTFLSGLSAYGLKSADLFDADELYYASNFARVVHCLAALSKSQIAGLAGFRYFDGGPPASAAAGGSSTSSSRSSSRPPSTSGGLFQHDDVYGTLEDLVGQAMSLEEAAADSAPVFDNAEEEEDEVYQSLRAMVGSSAAAADVYSSMVTSSTVSKRGAENDIYSSGAPDDKRNHVLAELIETEGSYVKALQVIAGIQQALAAQPKIFSKIDLKTVFSNLGDILAVHRDFIAQLQTLLASQTGRMVGRCITSVMRPLRCYAQFCCDIPEAIARLKELEAKAPSRAVLEQARKDSGQRFPLADLLNVPMQRILKYPLLIKELIKHTPDSHPDKKNLAEALTACTDLAKYIDDTKKDNDNLKNMISTLKNYSGKALQEYGTLSKDGDLMYKFESAKDAGKERGKLRYVFLFGSAILLCKPKDVYFHYKATIEFEPGHEIIEAQASREEAGSKYTFCWALRNRRGDCHVFAAKSLPLKKKWMAAMQLNVDLVLDRRPEAAPRTGTMTASPPRVPVSRPPALSPQTSASSAQPQQQQRKGSATAAPAAAAGKSYEEWVVGGGPPASSPAASPPPSKVDAMLSDATSWYAGKIPRPKAEKILQAAPDGTFMVRESDAHQGSYSLSVKYGHVKHIKINYSAGKYDVAPDSKSFSTIQELVEHFQVHSLNRHFPGMETTLAIPYKAAMSRSGRDMGIGRCRSRFAYVAKSPDELSFERGLEIVLLSVDTQDPGWWSGRLPSGQEGIFPANYVQRL